MLATMKTRAVGGLGLWSLLTALGCSSEKVASDGEGAAGSPTDTEVGTEVGLVQLSVEPDRRAFVELSGPRALEIEGDGEKSIAWDLAFQGRDVFLNGGVSGPGNASAFGPLSPPTFLSDTAPEVPLLLEDRPGGALLDWYDYGGETHQLFSRYHVYGLRDGERLFKLQILSYYGERLGTPLSAHYRIRYAEVFEDGVGELQELAEIDATAGEDATDPRQPSACVDLDRQQVLPLTLEEAGQSDAWQLCFRRESIAVNGGLSGPRGMEAVDLQADATAGETEADIQGRSEDSELPLFEAVDHAALTDDALTWTSDGVVTAFGRRWLDAGREPAALSDSVWLVVAADGASKYLVRFESLDGDLGDAGATLSLRAKAVK